MAIDTQRYDEMLEAGTITDEEYKLLTTEPEPEPEPDTEPEPQPLTGSFFEDYVHDLNGDEI